jgi:hypothetical protein
MWKAWERARRKLSYDVLGEEMKNWKDWRVLEMAQGKVLIGKSQLLS